MRGRLKTQKDPRIRRSTTPPPSDSRPRPISSTWWNGVGPRFFLGHGGGGRALFRPRPEGDRLSGKRVRLHAAVAHRSIAPRGGTEVPAPGRGGGKTCGGFEKREAGPCLFRNPH